MAPPVAPEPTVLYEDNHCLAVVKPAGMLVAADSTGDESLLERAREYLKTKYGKPGNVYLGLVHRLDRPVSGIVLFARTSKSASRLSEQFRTSAVRKRYCAIVEGSPIPAEATLTDWLTKDETRNVSRVVAAQSPGGKLCRLHYRVTEIHSRRDRARVEIDLETGRSHQIRVQLSHRGWPIWGDTKYGSGHQLNGAIALHAFELTFDHPVRHEPIRLETPPPALWEKAWPQERPR